MLPPHLGIGLELKISRLLSRKSRIHCGSPFMSEIWWTISASIPLRALKTYFDSVRKSYLLISVMAGSKACSVMSVAMVNTRDLLVGGLESRRLGHFLGLGFSGHCFLFGRGVRISFPDAVVTPLVQ